MHAPPPPKAELGSMLYRELYKVLSNSALSPDARTEAVFQLVQLIFQEASRRDKLPFTTHFARMAYVAHQYALPKPLQYYLHQFRRLARRADDRALPTTALLGAKAAAEAILAIWRTPLPEELALLLPLDWTLPMQEVAVVAYRPVVRVLVLDDDAAAEQLVARDADRPEQDVRIQYHLAERNEMFTPTIEIIRKVTGFPVQMNLLDVEVDAMGVYRPRALVLEPDFLVDVTAVAECFQGSSTHPWGYLLKKFQPYEQTPALMLGNIANFFLDALMNDPNVTYPQLTQKIFALNPLAFCLFGDAELRDMMGKAQGHFVRIASMVATGFQAEGMDHDHCYLEPTFYSERYGLQGRLDLLYHSPKTDKRTAIVELKSGKPFMPNVHGIGPSHYIQTVLYDFLVRSAFGANTNVGCYILYSSEQERPLRFAPAVKAQQYEALQVRNHLVAIEYLLAQLGTGNDDMLTQTHRLFSRLQSGRYPHIKGFAAKAMDAFTRVFEALQPIEQAYLGAFTGFIAREHLLAKTGVQGIDQLNGLASLWLDDPQDKEQNYQRLAELDIVQQHTRDEEPILVLSRTAFTNPLANFRVGDIAVLFPHSDDGRGVLSHQVFKCSIIAIDADQVTIRLRSQQFNDALFRQPIRWTIEHDLLDSSINAYYQGLYQWATSLPRQRQLVMGALAPAAFGAPAMPDGGSRVLRSHLPTVGTTSPPGPAPIQSGPPSVLTHSGPNATPPPPTTDWPDGPTAEQRHLLDAMLAAPDYYLLWGPPGTGKTSVVLHHLVRHLLDHTDEHILLLAYTNRAVDEICESIEAIRDDVRSQYLRIGSNYGTHPRYQAQLLQNAIQGITNRRDLKALIADRRIIVGTVASLANKPELFRLKHFHRVIIDEASQILEPILAGLLVRFPRWILIGDHRQLPAVVAQQDGLTRITDPLLREHGITHLGQSLFERLYLKCQAQGWTWAYGQLTHQGRMHADIMDFPAQRFYQQQLRCLPDGTPTLLRQTQPIAWSLPPDANVLAQQIAKRRLIFLPTSVDEDSPTLKTNRHEARLLVDLIQAFRYLADYNQTPLRPGSIGIITPYRAQIAQIRSLLEAEKLNPDDFTIDTVERYQGGARDIVLISLCTNSARQVKTLSALSDEGIDRKLNVAMTRARDHLVILGNADLLRESPVYAALLDYIQAMNL